MLTTGTGSGRSLSSSSPSLIILEGQGQMGQRRTRAIVILPDETHWPTVTRRAGKVPCTAMRPTNAVLVARYTGRGKSPSAMPWPTIRQTSCLPTNFMMLEYILTRFDDVDRGWWITAKAWSFGVGRTPPTEVVKG